MNTAALGTWSNPPLAYVVAEITISPYYSIAEVMPLLQAKLREIYPRTLEEQELIFDGPKPSPHTVWRLMSVDQTHGVQFGMRAIALHATSYQDSGDFLRRWTEVIDAVDSQKLGMFVERVGLRYVDIIVPDDNLSPSKYLDEQLHGFTLEGAALSGSMWAAAFQFGDDVTVNFRCAAPSPRGMVLPPDYNALPLHKPRIMIEAEQCLKLGKQIGFIDTDCFKSITQVFDAKALTETFIEMQKFASRTFKASISPLAKDSWI
jgi:uncharacterized protein (TIGR04255 family)